MEASKGLSQLPAASNIAIRDPLPASRCPQPATLLVFHIYVSYMYYVRMPHRRHHRRSRIRRQLATGQWEVTARVERFVEPALLLALAEGRSHGYELADRLAEVIGVESVDFGNLYRLLRSLEEEGIVSSEWEAQLDAPSKRQYEITTSGEHLLEAWADALRQSNERIEALLLRYEERNPA